MCTPGADLELLLPCTVFETRASSLVRSRESARGALKAGTDSKIENALCVEYINI